MEISFNIHTQILVHLYVNQTNFHMKGFALGLALKHMRNATRKSPIHVPQILWTVPPVDSLGSPLPSLHAYNLHL